MAEFSDNIIDVFYFDQEKTIINVEWRGKDEKIRRFFVNVDEKDSNYRDLVAEGWDEDKIEESTREYRRRARKAFEKECMLIAEREGIIDTTELGFTKVFDFLNRSEDEIGAEELFKFKIEAFDNQAVVECTDTSVKRAIRQAKTYKEVIDIVMSINTSEVEEDASEAQEAEAEVETTSE